MTTTLDAVDLYRQLTSSVARDRGSYLPRLAKSLNQLSSSWLELSRFEAALTTAQEAIEVYRELVNTDASGADVYRTSLAAALRTVYTSLSKMGRQQESIAPGQEAISLFRQITNSNHPSTKVASAHLLVLAQWLSELGQTMSSLGMFEEALEPAEEAVALFGQLVALHPESDVQLSFLASALRTFGSYLSSLNREDAASSVLQESAATYRRLVDFSSESADQYADNLAETLSQLGLSLMIQGKALEAFSPIQEAINHFRKGLHGDAEGSYLKRDKLARMLGIRALVLADRDVESAIESMEQAVKYWTELSQQSLLPSEGSLIFGLTKLAELLERAEHHEEAVEVRKRLLAMREH